MNKYFIKYKMYVKIRNKLTASMHRLGDWRYARNIHEKLAESLGCPLGNQTTKSGCPAPFYCCPGRPYTRFVKAWATSIHILVVRYKYLVFHGFLPPYFLNRNRVDMKDLRKVTLGLRGGGDGGK